MLVVDKTGLPLAGTQLQMLTDHRRRTKKLRIRWTRWSRLQPLLLSCAIVRLPAAVLSVSFSCLVRFFC